MASLTRTTGHYHRRIGGTKNSTDRLESIIGVVRVTTVKTNDEREESVRNTVADWRDWRGERDGYHVTIAQV